MLFVLVAPVGVGTQVVRAVLEGGLGLPSYNHFGIIHLANQGAHNVIEELGKYTCIDALNDESYETVNFAEQQASSLITAMSSFYDSTLSGVGIFSSYMRLARPTALVRHSATASAPS